MIYWFTGQHNSGKTVLGTKLKDFLQTEKRNWRKDVFHIDTNDFKEIVDNNDCFIDENIQLIAHFIHHKGCDVVVSSVSPNIELRESFKNIIGDSIIEIYVHNTRKKQKEEFKVENYQAPQFNFFDLDTTSENPNQSFTKLIHYLRHIDKL
jgi:adenylylsulfate kinase-like enzyme